MLVAQHTFTIFSDDSTMEREVTAPVMPARYDILYIPGFAGRWEVMNRVIDLETGYVRVRVVYAG